MIGHTTSAVDKYLNLAGKNVTTLKKVSTPCIDDHQLSADDNINKGELAPIAAKIVLTALYVARLNRHDLLWAVNTLARQVTKWTVGCDKRLHRLISYMYHTKDYVTTSYVGDSPDKCTLALFVDASFAGDLADSKSTTGGYLVLTGPNTFAPITWMCKKQCCVTLVLRSGDYYSGRNSQNGRSSSIRALGPRDRRARRELATKQNVRDSASPAASNGPIRCRLGQAQLQRSQPKSKAVHPRRQ